MTFSLGHSHREFDEKKHGSWKGKSILVGVGNFCGFDKLFLPTGVRESPVEMFSNPRFLEGVRRGWTIKKRKKRFPPTLLPCRWRKNKKNKVIYLEALYVPKTFFKNPAFSRWGERGRVIYLHNACICEQLRARGKAIAGGGGEEGGNLTIVKNLAAQIRASVRLAMRVVESIMVPVLRSFVSAKSYIS